MNWDVTVIMMMYSHHIVFMIGEIECKNMKRFTCSILWWTLNQFVYNNRFIFSYTVLYIVCIIANYLYLYHYYDYWYCYQRRHWMNFTSFLFKANIFNPFSVRKNIPLSSFIVWSSQSNDGLVYTYALRIPIYSCF